jgi:hypothetical protein
LLEISKFRILAVTCKVEVTLKEKAISDFDQSSDILESVTYAAGKTLCNKLVIWAVANDIVNVIHADLVLSNLGSQSVHVTVVASIESSDIASV